MGSAQSVVASASGAEVAAEVAKLSAANKAKLRAALKLEQLASAATACIAAGEKAPCIHCGCLFAEQWGDAPWHCFKCKKPLDPVRAAPETAAKAAVEALDAPLMSGGKLSEDGQRKHAARGVTVGFLVELCAELPPGITTAEVVERIIKPRTASLRCRYVELEVMRAHVGEPRAFVSHTWKAPFADLVAALAYVLEEHECVWLDVFAVRQWPGNGADLDFRARRRLEPSPSA